MKSIFKGGVILNTIILIYLIIIIFLQLIGKINYGHGLGDLFDLMFIVGVVIIQFLLIVIISRKTNNSRELLLFILGLFFLFIAIYITWEFTLGRGGEYRWNGYIFIA